MDKDYSKLIYAIIAIILIIIGSFGLKSYLHRREILRLLQIKPADNIINISANENNESSYNSKVLLGNISDNEHYSKKINSTSQSVSKKVKTGKDMISDIDIIEQNDIQQSRNSNNNYANSDDVLLLARLIMSEAGDEPYLGKLAVGNVVLYRTEQDNASLSDTIFKKNQFDGVQTSNFNIQPNADSIQAATEVLNGEKAILDGYFFVNLNVASPSWAREDNFIVRIGDHWFFRKE